MRKVLLLFTFLLVLCCYGANAQVTGPANQLRFGTADPATCTPQGNNVFFRTDTGQLKMCTATNTWSVVGAGAGSGNVTGPAGATDNAITRFDGATGTLIQNSLVTIDDTGVFGFPAGVRQTFSPNGTTPGLNVGSFAGNPSTPANGDAWYNSTGNVFNIRSNGATITLRDAAPVAATYITQTADGTLSAEQALSALSTGIVVVTTGTGVLTSITNSAGLGANISDKTGSTFVVFADSPVLTTQATIPKIIWTGTVQDLAGSGSPEGVVTAPVGSVYRRTNGTASNTLYVKESGAGNTGWIAYGAAAGGGVTGPGSSTANAIATWNGTTGIALLDNSVTISSGLVAQPSGTAGGIVEGGSALLTTYTGTTNTPRNQFGGITSLANASLALSFFNGATANGPALFMTSSRGASVGSYTVMVNSDTLGTIAFEGADGTDFARAATITGAVDGTPGANQMPGKLIFATSPAGSQTPSTALTIDATQKATFAGAIAGVSATFSSTIVQTSASAAAFESGPNGSTNPVFRLVNNTGSAVTGLTVTGKASGSGVELAVISSGSNEDFTLTPKGTGDVVINGTDWTVTAAGNLTTTGSVTTGSGSSVAGTLTLIEGTAPSLTANAVQHIAAVDAPAGGVAYLWGSTAAATGVLRVANSSGTMTVTQDAGISHLAASTSADLRGVLTDEKGAGSFWADPKRDVIDSATFCSDAGGTDSYACTLSPAITGYVTGTHYRFKANTANTGVATINLNALGAITIKKVQGGITTDLADNDIRVGQWVDVVYDGTNMQMISPLGNVPAGAGTVTASGGSLTANSVVLGAGGTDTKVVAGIITDGTSKLTLGVAGASVGDVDFKNATSGTISLQPVTGALGSAVLSLPAATDTLVAKATTDILTNKTIDAEGTGNVVTIPVTMWLPAAGCNNATAASFWDLPTSTPAVATCFTGTNIQKGALDFADTSGGFSAQITYRLPSDWSGNIDASIFWTTSVTTGNAVWQLATACGNTDATEVDDNAFNTLQTVTTAAPGTANRTQTSTITSLTLTGCSAGDLFHLKLFRDGANASDTLGTTARVIGVELKIRRAM